MELKYFMLYTSAGRSPTFQDPGTPLDGLAGTRESGRAGPELTGYFQARGVLKESN